MYTYTYVKHVYVYVCVHLCTESRSFKRLRPDSWCRGFQPGLWLVPNGLRWRRRLGTQGPMRKHEARLIATLFFLVVTFFVSFPRRDTKTLVYLSFFRPQSATALKYSICGPLQARSLAYDEARGSSATHPSSPATNGNICN